MILLKVNQFQGQIPSVAAQLLPGNAAQAATNCKLINGNLAAIRENSVVNDPAKSGTILSIYRFNNFWFHWLDDVDCVPGLVAGNTQDRTYFTEGGELRVTDATIATSGGTQYPMDWYKVGIPAPTSALIATLTGDPDNPDDFENTESRSYLYTFVSASGEEGPPSPASNIINWNPGQAASLSGFNGAPTGDYQITTIRIYRRQASAYRYVKEVSIPVTTTEDAVASDAVSSSEEIPSADWYPPPNGLHSIVNHPSSFMIGAVGNEIALSEAGLPHAYNPFNRHTLPYDIVGLGVVGQGVLILTGAGLWYAAGTSPDSFGPPEKIEADQSCSSKQSIFDIDGAIGFASPDGLYAYGVGTSGSLTSGLFTIDQWRNLNPSSMICAHHDGKIFVFYDNGNEGGFVIYPGEVPTKVDLDFHATAVFLDRETDTLYMMVGSYIVAYEGGTLSKQATWKGRVERPPYDCCPAVAQVKATGYPVTFKLYADGTVKHSQIVANSRPFRLPGGYRAEEFEVECIVDSGREVSEVIVGESMSELRSV